MAVIKCSSCSINLKTEEGFVQFKCPACDKGGISRCARCKKLSNVYTCPKCGFEGP